MDSFSTRDKPGKWLFYFLHCPERWLRPREVLWLACKPLPNSEEPGSTREAWLEVHALCLHSVQYCVVVDKHSFFALRLEKRALPRGREADVLVCRHINQKWRSKRTTVLWPQLENHTPDLLSWYQFGCITDFSGTGVYHCSRRVLKEALWRLEKECRRWVVGQ